ncbi:jerky protein homolog-like [Rhagoletis pomonella]|uniref:jerky protein homolog-like n=1 Tax=Rhagoletis pomonella TaxID=28610 RepID=UPI001784F825|nr:jerky protein homolog-like [Rhagoletis pomonella]
MRCAEYQMMEERLYNWFIKKRQLNVRVSSEILREKAKVFCSEIYGSNVEFFASKGWFNNFRSRYGIKFLKISGEKLTNDSTAVQPFIEQLQTKIREKGLTNSQIYNADETALFWKKLPDKTLALRTEKTAPGRKIGKERITLLVCCNASGEHKLKLLMIGKAKNPRVFKQVKLPLEYANSTNAWMTEMIFRNWFKNSFVVQVRKHLKEKNLPVKALLLLDNATCHPLSLASSEEDICVMFLPPNCTALVQPMDQNAIRILKVNYRKSFLSFMLSNLTDNLTDVIKKFSLKDVAFLVMKAWNAVGTNIIYSDDDLPLAQLRSNP